MSKTPADQALPYARSALVNFNAKGLKPNTRVYPFFDGQSVSEHCRSASATLFGGELVTDSLGELSGVFRIPTETFKTGTRQFVLTNNSSDPTIKTDCIAITTYTSYGAITYDTGKIASTRAPNITFAKASSPRELSIERIVTVNPSTTSFQDPVAQTFFVSGNPNGIFATKIDIYFKTKPTDPNIPITLQIRDTVNGNPGQDILPFSSVTLYPKDVNASSDSNAPTKFIFSSPVHLQNNQEYAIVLLPAGGREGYEIWTAELGQTKLGTGEKIDKQPASGRLYISSNSVNWTVSETRDMKYTLYNANFNVPSGTLYLKNKKMDYLGITNDTVTILVGDVFTGNSSGAIGTVRLYDTSRKIAHVEITSGAFTDDETVTIRRVSGGSTAGTASINIDPYEPTVEGKLMHKLASAISYVEFNDSAISFEHKIYNSDEVSPSGYTPMAKKGITTLGEEKTIYSYSYEKNPSGLNITSSSQGSVMMKVNLSTSNPNISPIIDITKSGLVSYQNMIAATRKTISGTVTGNTSSDTLTGTSTAFINHIIPGSALRNEDGVVIGIVKNLVSATSLVLEENSSLNLTNERVTVDYESTDVLGTSKYHTRYVNLPPKQEADDLMVFLDANIPAGTDVRVYARLLALGDATDIKKRPWTQLVKTFNATSLGAGDLVYKLQKNGHDENTKIGGLNASGIFEYAVGGISFTQYKTYAIKIVLSSTDSYYRPEVYSMRVMSLMA